MNFARILVAVVSAAALAAFAPELDAADCDIVAAYCPADDYYYDICATCTDGDCWDELMAAIAAAGMSYEGDESVGQGPSTCFDEPCASGNPSCPGLQLYDVSAPWRVGVHVVCCNGHVVKAAAVGSSYCEALAKAKATAFRLAKKKCCCCTQNKGIRCYYVKILSAPADKCCYSSKKKRGLCGLLGRIRRR
ncbi:MAG TPA: hypothetical protein DDW52_27280 [Planctomycetaceae bacterium]|nr:hypothetical protein [Planctomycetaceae bacterium]